MRVAPLRAFSGSLSFVLFLMEARIVPDRKPLSVAFAFAIALSVIASPVMAEILKKEPAMGQLREGEVVLVDDGSCPSEQIKQVIGGNHVKVGGTKHIVRTYKCIPK